MPLLPATYYHAHFDELLSFVETHHAALLDDAARDLIAAYRALPLAAQCLYLRMANRRFLVFARAALNYAEIPDRAAALAALCSTGFARVAEARDAARVLAIQTRPALLACARQTGLAVRTSWSRAQLLAALQAGLPAAALKLDDYVIQGREEEIAYLLFLHFGGLDADMKGFALRDLGLLSLRDTGVFAARFADAAEARTCFALSRRLATLDDATPEDYADAAAGLLATTPPAGERAQALLGRMANRLGAFFEKTDAAKAEAIYRAVPTAEGNERLVRMLHARGELVAARRLLERMLDDPASDAEHDFATDFHARKYAGQRRGACTALLNAAEQITIDDIWRDAPEAGAAAAFRRAGWRAWHVENALWHALFGLLFADVLAEAARHSPFDALPPSLRDGSFMPRHAGAIAARLAAIRAGAAAALLAAAGQPRADSIFAQHGLDPAMLIDFATAADPAALAGILEAMCRDFQVMRDGFPDLLLLRAGEVRLVEIKSTGDALRRNQLTRLRQLAAAGFAAGIHRVDFRYDPAQTYVVVDLETTGLRASHDRVIEIGAVRLRGNAILDEFHTLLNPRRPVPRQITALTGISAAMLEDAPEFADIAAALSEFLRDGIFVAHHVGFDYGFLGQEYRRLGESLRMPKFCTAAGMRRHFPGRGSYALGALCADFGIALDRPHRAREDALAAAGLLRLINARRQDQAAT